MQVTGARVICGGCAECAGVVCRNVHIVCGRACGMCEVVYGVRVMGTLCGMHLSG